MPSGSVNDWLAELERVAAERDVPLETGIDVEAQVAALEAVKRSNVEQYHDTHAGETISAATLRAYLTDKEWRPAGETVDPTEPLPDPWHFIDDEGNRCALSPVDD